ncbi:hypothetical protein HWI79_3205 [Cryptosporidium felis]|nr:hypothetical protein HWI79_3205 [Cryptosporidium felis]
MDNKSGRKKSQESNRELLEIPENGKSQKLEEMLCVVGHERSSPDEMESKQGISSSQLPPWKRNPAGPKSDVLERAKNFLAMCEVVGNQSVTEDCTDQEKKVVMDVHLGVFDVNGELSEGDSLSEKEVVDVTISQNGSPSETEPCQIEEYSDFCDPEDSNPANVSGQERAIQKLLSRSKPKIGDPEEKKGFVEVVSSSEIH